MSAEDDPDAYERAVEEAFNRRRGAPHLLSPRDWGILTAWREAGVPLRIVLQGIDNAFDSFERRGPTARKINSLAYCRQEVLTLHEIALSLQAAEAGRPGPGDDPRAAVARHLGRLARQVRASATAASEAGLDSLVGALAQAASELKRHRKALAKDLGDPEPIEKILAGLDAHLLESARRALGAAEMQGIEESAAASLGASGARMSAEALAATRAHAVARLVRLRCHLPRLTLFD
jgi:hypothetical protein